jgi:hypothetical protein
LNWHVHVDPLSLSTTSLPATFPPDTAVVVFDDVDDPDDPDDELPPHAASSMHTTASAISH